MLEQVILKFVRNILAAIVSTNRFDLLFRFGRAVDYIELIDAATRMDFSVILFQ